MGRLLTCALTGWRQKLPCHAAGCRVQPYMHASVPAVCSCKAQVDPGFTAGNMAVCTVAVLQHGCCTGHVACSAALMSANCCFDRPAAPLLLVGCGTWLDDLGVGRCKSGMILFSLCDVQSPERSIVSFLLLGMAPESGALLVHVGGCRHNACNHQKCQNEVQHVVVSLGC